ncbi:MAG: glycosyltransferase family 2 protein, partial [Cyclobacteriaceae bacterium]
ILLTDADCRPSKSWVSEMAKYMNREIVIGLSPYQEYTGFLNQLIQFETFQTALHFVSSAADGKPYMALGRNLAYKKSLFENVGGFGKMAGITGGDDDLLIQKMISSDNFTMAFSPASRVDSIPKTTWSGYWKQKTRHFSVGKFYPPKVKRAESFRWFLHTGMWLAFFPTFIANPFLATLILTFTFVIKAISINIVADRLEKRFNHLWLPFVDLVYAVLMPVIGLRSLLVKNIKWN